MVGAASSTSRNVDLATQALAGLTSTAIRTALGTKSCRSRRRLATTSWVKKLMPVALPPGRARLATRPSWTGSSATAEDDRNGCGRSFGRKSSRRVGGRRDHGHLSAHQIGQQCRQAIILALQPAILDRQVLAFDVADFVEAFAERGRTGRGAIGRPAVDKCNHRHRRLLRARGERPRDRKASKCNLKFPPV